MPHPNTSAWHWTRPFYLAVFFVLNKQKNFFAERKIHTLTAVVPPSCQTGMHFIRLVFKAFLESRFAYLKKLYSNQILIKQVKEVWHHAAKSFISTLLTVQRESQVPPQSCRRLTRFAAGNFVACLEYLWPAVYVAGLSWQQLIAWNMSTASTRPGLPYLTILRD